VVVEQEMDEKWGVTESLILTDVLITVSTGPSPRTLPRMMRTLDSRIYNILLLSIEAEVLRISYGPSRGRWGLRVVAGPECCRRRVHKLPLNSEV